MRLVLLPISTRRTLLYCIRIEESTTNRPSLVDKASAKAASLWASWERRESGWQHKVVGYGNAALRKVPFQEWGLKSVPPLTARRRAEELARKEKVELMFPPSIIAPHDAERVLHKLGTEREALHRTRLAWCFVGMPITAPVALLPVIPNVPFFYLAYRAWSHWRAIKGGHHVQFFVKNKLLAITPSPILDAIYATPKLPPSTLPADAKSEEASSSEDPTGTEKSEPAEKVLVTRELGKLLGEALEHPEIEVEIDRALWQVEQQMDKDKTRAGGGVDSKKQ